VLQLVNVIIPVCKNVVQNDCEDRLENLQIILNRFLAKQADVHVRAIIVEQTTNEKPYFLPRLTIPKEIAVVKKHISYPMFYKGWCYNVGMRLAEGEHLVFGESDCASPDNSLLARILAFVENGRFSWAIGWDKLYRIGRRERQTYAEGFKFKPGGAEWIPPRPHKAEGGLVYLPRRFFLRLGGYSEFLKGLGGYDNDICFRAKYLSGKYPKCRKGTLMHLYHEFYNVKTDRNRLDNLAILECLYKNAAHVCRQYSTLGDVIGGNVPIDHIKSFWAWVYGK